MSEQDPCRLCLHDAHWGICGINSCKCDGKWFPKLRPEPRGERIGFIERAIRIRAEIKQIFLDADHWNRIVRKPDEESINPDPKGELKNILEALERFIGPETQ